MTRKGALHPAKVTLRNVYAVFQALFRKIRRNMGGFDLQHHIYEQILWRRIQVIDKSPDCWNSNSCVWCGCEIQGMTMEDRGCKRDDEKGPCYPEMMSKENWEIYKKAYNIKLFK